jgi:hypothetical protein
VPQHTRTPITKQVRAIRKSLRAIERSLERLVAATKATGRGASAKRGAGRRKLKLSAERRAVLKLQGRYMALLRGLKPRKQVEVKAVRARRGFPAAIALAHRLAKR